MLQSAFDAVADNDTIQVITSTLAENPLTFNRSAVTATLRGGYDALPSGTVTGVTTIQGRLNIRDGKLIVSGVAIRSTL